VPRAPGAVGIEPAIRPAAGLRGCAKVLAQKDVLVTVWVVVHYRHDFKSVPGIKGGSLEAERHEKYLPAAPPARFLFCRRKQPRPQPLPATRLLHPELANLRATAPRIPTDPGNDPMGVVPHEDREPRAVGDACRGAVELIEPILEALDLDWRRLGADDEFRSAHCL
jgi:hypothetical protein